jgi:hypothetical protein
MFVFKVFYQNSANIYHIPVYAICPTLFFPVNFFRPKDKFYAEQWKLQDVSLFSPLLLLLPLSQFLFSPQRLQCNATPYFGESLNFAVLWG